jgi:hypothetical protein
VADRVEHIDAEHDDGRYRLRCTCGWESPWNRSAAVVGAAFDDHYRRGC